MNELINQQNLAEIVSNSTGNNRNTDLPFKSQWTRKTLPPYTVYILLQLYAYNTIDNNINKLEINLSISQLIEWINECMAEMYGIIGAQQYSYNIIHTIRNESTGHTRYIIQCHKDTLIPFRSCMSLNGMYKSKQCIMDIIGCSTTLLGITQLL